MIWLDRKLVHPTIYLSDDDGFRQATELSRSQYHPEFREMYDKYHTNSQPIAPANASEPRR
jgi:hypothetical protein